MKLQTVVAAGLPARSRAAEVPPVSVTVYLVFEARVAPGFRTHWLLVPLRVTVAVTAAPVVAFLSLNVVADTPCIGSLNVAVMLFARRTPVALTAGVLAVIVGAAPVMKDQLVLASGVPTVSRIAVVPPVRVAVYRVSAARLAVGLRVATRVVAL